MIDADLARGLRERQGEIERAVLTRVHAISDPAEVADPLYVEGLRDGVVAAIEHGLSAIESGEGRTAPIPSVLRGQARVAARNGVGLDTVLRRYFAGYTLLSDYVIEHAQNSDGLDQGTSKRILRALGLVFNDALTAVSEEYKREAETRPAGSDQRRAKCVKGLLAGELVDASGLSYEIANRWHLGLVACGLDASPAIRHLASALDCRLLLVHPGEGKIWVWLGAGRKVMPEAVAQAASSSKAGEVALAIGEPGCGLSGWRLTHRQALAALPIGLRGSEKVVRYAEVAVLAAAIRDDVLISSLPAIYLSPLERERDGGAVFLQTLCSYFEAGRQVAATAATLGVSRQTVSNRLRSIEERIGRRVNECAAEIETALRLKSLSTRQLS